jgi:hypothetical protein
MTACRRFTHTAAGPFKDDKVEGSKVLDPLAQTTTHDCTENAPAVAMS